MSKTEKLYDKDAYATEFEAVVLTCERTEKGYEVELDRTLFFPEEGGQTPDFGTLDEVPVTYVRIQKDTIYHLTEREFTPGSTVRGKIDWNHRFSNMQQHTGEHIFSGLVHREYGYDNVGFHLSDSVVTMDFSGPLSKDQLQKLEREVNEVIVKNVPVTAEYPTPEVLRELPYRSKKELTGEVRIVTIQDVDMCACCAPHVARTGEIGMFKIMDSENYKGGVRIRFLCGFRALEEYGEKMKILSELSRLTSEKQEKLTEAVKKLKDARQQLEFLYMKERGRYLQEKVDSSKESGPVLWIEEELSPILVRDAVNSLVKKHSGYCGIFVKKSEEEYTFVLGSADKDATEAIEKLRGAGVIVRGGGSTAMVQGSVMAKEEELKKALPCLSA